MSSFRSGLIELQSFIKNRIVPITFCQILIVALIYNFLVNKRSIYPSVFEVSMVEGLLDSTFSRECGILFIPLYIFIIFLMFNDSDNLQRIVRLESRYTIWKKNVLKISIISVAFSIYYSLFGIISSIYIYGNGCKWDSTNSYFAYATECLFQGKLPTEQIIVIYIFYNFLVCILIGMLYCVLETLDINKIFNLLFSMAAYILFFINDSIYIFKYSLTMKYYNWIKEEHFLIRNWHVYFIIIILFLLGGYLNNKKEYYKEN